MEEQIINILVKHIIGCDDGFGGLNRGVMDDSIEDVAKEIVSMATEFILWLSLNAHIATSYSPMYYLYVGTGEERHIDFTKEHHIDEVYKEWLRIKE
jgi:hypothetical protein